MQVYRHIQKCGQNFALSGIKLSDKAEEIKIIQVKSDLSNASRMRVATPLKKIRDFLHEAFREHFLPDYELASGQFRQTPRYQS